MRILHVINYYQPGMGYQENHLPAFQNKLGHEVKIVTSNRYYPFENFEEFFGERLGDRFVNAGSIIKKGVEIERHEVYFELISRRLVLLKKLYSSIDKFKPDVIHINGITNLNLIYLILREKKYKIFIDVHSDFDNKNITFLSRILYTMLKIYYRLDKKINGFTAISIASKKFIERYFSNKKKISLLELGCDTNIMRFLPEKREIIRTKLNIPKDAFLIINTGKQNHTKRTIELILAFKKLLENSNNKHFFLIFIGSSDKDFAEKIEEVVYGNSLESKIIFRSYLPNRVLAEYFSAADLAIYPGSATISIQEAMGCRLPVLFRKNENTQHLIVDESVVIKHSRVETIYNSLANIVYDEKKLEFIGNANEELIKDNYSFEKIADKSLKIYKQKSL